LVQFSRIGDDDDEVDHDDMVSGPESDHMTLLHSLALAVLASDFDVIKNPDRYDEEHENVEKTPSPGHVSRLRNASSNDVKINFLQQTEELSNFVDADCRTRQGPHQTTRCHLVGQMLG
jgi:hypothetical protein